ncbi:MAG: Cache domain-containing protein [Cyanobacteria bacterium P01_D01_bin.56]
MRSKVSNPKTTESTTIPSGPTQVAQQKNKLRQNLLGWLQLNSFGGRLFWMIMVGALTGVGGMAFLFSEMIKYQAEEQVQSTLDGQVNAISSVTEAAETLAYGLGVSATTLHERQAQFPDTYRELTLQLFERRPEFILGLGLGQKENGLIVDQSWLFPYYWADSAKELSSTRQAPIHYEDFADDEGEFYPDSARYQDYFLPQKEVWTDPHQANGNQLLTYYFPLLASDGRWLGTSLVDIDINYLSDLLDVPVFRQQGNFILLNRSGNVIVNPANANAGAQTYEEIADLKDFWYGATEETGFFEGEEGYWSYANVPGQDWVVFGFVPYGAVFNRIALITLAATTLMVALLSVAIFFAVRSLGRRLRPVLNQCNQLAKTDDTLLAQWDNQDDLNQLSLAFFNMLEKLNLNEETIRRHEQKIKKDTLHSDQVAEQFGEFAKLFSREAGEQQMLIRRLQDLTAQLTNNSQSVDIQLDAVSTMGRALDGELRRVPAHSSEALAVLEQQLQELVQVIQTETEHPSGMQLQTLANLAAKNVATLKAHDRRRPSVDSLQEQTGNITRAGEVAAEGARSMVDTSRSMAEILAKVERIATLLAKRAKAVLD